MEAAKAEAALRPAEVAAEAAAEALEAVEAAPAAAEAAEAVAAGIATSPAILNPNRSFIHRAEIRIRGSSRAQRSLCTLWTDPRLPRQERALPPWRATR